MPEWSHGGGGINVISSYLGHVIQIYETHYPTPSNKPSLSHHISCTIDPSATHPMAVASILAVVSNQRKILHQVVNFTSNYSLM